MYTHVKPRTAFEHKSRRPVSGHNKVKQSTRGLGINYFSYKNKTNLYSTFYSFLPEKFSKRQKYWHRQQHPTIPYYAGHCNNNNNNNKDLLRNPYIRLEKLLMDYALQYLDCRM